MTETLPGGPGTSPAGPAPALPPKRRNLLGRTLRDPVALGCLVVLALVIVASVAASLLTGASPTRSSLNDTLAPMSGAHPLGGDGVGRDVLARLLYGGRTSLLGGTIATVVALVVGGPLGLISGFYRGWFDAVAGWVIDVIMAVPAIIVMLVVMAVVSQDLNVAMAVLGVIMAPMVFRLIRASVLAVREELYVDAARVSGLSDARVMRRHILPVVVAPSVIQATQMFAVAIGIQAGLAFLGLGKSSQASWGAMLNDAFANVYTAPSLLVWPGLAMMVTILAASMLGNSLRDALGTSEARRPGRRKGRRRPAGAVPPGGSSAGQDRKAAGRRTAGQKAADHKAAGQGTTKEEQPLLSLEGLRVTYPRPDGDRTVVHGVSLAVHRGEVLGLVGESGSGKSQTAFSVLGLLPPDAEVSASALFFDGRDLTAMDQDAWRKLRGKRIGYIPQEPMSNLDPCFLIGSQLVEPMRRCLGLSRADAKKKALGLLERVGIPDPERVFRSYPHQISGGMAQRVLIAGAVSCDPQLLIADEPTTALDVTVQAEVLDLMRSLQQEREMGMILVTHNFGVVADICDRVAVMQTGRIVETAPARQIFAAPEHPYTQKLLGSTLEGGKARGPLKTAGTMAPAGKGI
ncbi:dipeptide/oligopeptide/nickel ABC transporter permease/ATP-binding protein [Actinacidiphila oryziradicis]|uniref:dipeptide/oligopeptide/nickel ABC transporter permease/ATP-binding protein n=1 Tax=Actinacidiphila oryziradicis TaxID=2571141 RepID=UPI0023F3358C|nr:dipeptide/oligopeptide/nickel ABC transporter permease/ATP-binding protein [Actinacidiphila oryziradicis]MCW2872405.1 transporter related protein [Actinacidiphila oryziradicis]